MVALRPLTPADYAAIAAIRSAYRPDPVAPADVQYQVEHSGRPGQPAHWFVAVDTSGAVAGVGGAGPDQWLPPEGWAIFVSVRRDLSGQGVGSRLLAHGEGLAREHAARDLYASCRGDDDSSYAWAQRRGYALHNQRTEGALDLTGWDGSRFAADLDRAKSGGIRLELTDGVPDEPVLQALYELEAETVPDVPDNRGMPFPPYEHWRSEWFDHRPKLTAIAFDGQRPVGLSLLGVPPAPGQSALTYTTGVARAYRGRGIALALKVLTINAAHQQGVTRLMTYNDPDNPPMLAVNRKLGYVIVPGHRKLIKHLQT